MDTYTPEVVITYEALEAMTNEVLDYPRIETSWQMVGFVTGNRHLIVTNVIRPGYKDVIRTMGNTTIGGEFNQECYQWLVDEFAKTSTMYPKMYPRNMAYGYCFAGHSHHTLGLRTYSGRDLTSILEAVRDDNLPVALGPLANINVGAFDGWSMGFSYGESVTIRRESDITWKFYYLNRDMVQAGQIDPIVVRPRFIRQSQLRFRVPVMAWRFTEPARFERQITLLREHGCQVTVMNRDLPAYDHLVVQFLINKDGWKSPVVVNTEWNFPYGGMPTFWVLIDGKKQMLPNNLTRDGAVVTVWPYGGCDILDAIIRLEQLEVV